MRTASRGRAAQARLDWVEGGALLLAAPILMFPTARPFLTGLFLLPLLGVWLVRIWRRDPLPVTPWNGAMLVLLLMVCVGASVTPFPALMVPKAAGILLGAASWSYLTRLGVRGVPYRWLALGLPFLGLGVVALGFLTTDWPTKVPLLGTLLTHLPLVLLRIPDAPAIGVHANELGGALVPFVPLALSMAVGWVTAQGVAGKMRLPAYALVGMGVVAAVLVALSQSRSAWVGVLAGGAAVIAAWAWSTPSRWLSIALRLALGVGVVGVAVLAVGLGADRIQGYLEEPAQMAALGGLSTLGFRVEVWRWAVTAIGDFPFTGCGLGAFREVGRLLYPMNIAPDYDYAHAHNIFLQMALDAGIPGLIGYLAILAVSVRSLWSVVRGSSELRPLGIGLLGGLVALHGYGLTDALAPGAKPGLVFWYVLGLSTVISLRQVRRVNV